MGRKKSHRQVEFKFEFDRLGKHKMEQVYEILFSKVLPECKQDKEELVHVEKSQ